MIHPSELLRTNSNAENFTAPVGGTKHKVDCGLSALPVLNRKLNLERYAKPAVFVAVLSVLGVIHGIVVTYFRGTSKVWSSIYNLPSETVEWAIYLNEILVGIFGLNVAYWGNRIHRPNWIGASSIFLSVAAFFLAVPEFEGHEANTVKIVDPALCKRGLSNLISGRSNDDYPIIEIVILVIYQLCMAIATTSFLSHGLSYIDDNLSGSHSPLYIGLAVSSIEIGRQIGLYCSWTPLVVQIGSVFTSAAWIIIIFFLFTTGCVMTFFPKVMPNTLITKSVTSLLDLAAGHPTVNKDEPVDGHCKTLWRILKNRIAMVTMFSVVFMQSAVVNFGILEKYFNQSKYHVPKTEDASGFSDIWLVQFTSNLLKQPMIAISIVLSGMLVSKFQPKPRYLVIYNVTVFITVAILFASTRFLNCTTKLENEISGELVQPYCSWNCACSMDGPFNPVCIKGHTYFSPCFAGCTSWDSDLLLYQNCSCNSPAHTASQGSCDAENCKMLLSLSQANNIISGGLLASTVVTHLLIILRSVSETDKAMALGLLLSFMGKIAYLPVRAIYKTITDNFCEIYSENNCQFYSPKFSLFLATATVTLMVVAALLGMLLLCFIDDLDLYKSETLADIVEEGTSNPRDQESNAEITEEDGEGGGQNARETTALVHQNYGRNRNNFDDDSDSVSTLTATKRDRVHQYLSQGDLVPPLELSSVQGKPQSFYESSKSSAAGENTKRNFDNNNVKHETSRLETNF